MNVSCPMLKKEQCSVCGKTLDRWWYIGDETFCRICKGTIRNEEKAFKAEEATEKEGT